MQGYIKLHRQITEWEWYSNINVCRLFIHCLLKANHKDNRWQGIVIERGSFITSIENLAFETGLSGQQVRTALNKLKLTGEITSKTTNRYSIISIKNWGSYQMDNTQDNKQITNKQQTDNKQITTNNNDKNDNNEKNVYLLEQKTKKIDPYTNSYIKYFKDEYKKVFGKQLYLDNKQCNKICELSADIEDFKNTIPVAINKLKNIDFGFDNYTADVNWLLKDSNYTAVLNGVYDTKQNKEDAVFERLREKAGLNG